MARTDTDITFVMAGESGVVMRFDENPSPELTHRLLYIANALAQTFPWVTDVMPSYSSLTVLFDALNADTVALCQHARELASHTPPTPTATTQTLPVCYDPALAPDLHHVCEYVGLDPIEVIALHSGQNYFAYANGFAPGFSYLGFLPSQLAIPRRKTPRPSVPAGAVAIADRQTAIYPRESAGGWHLIGRCPLALFRPHHPQSILIQVGDTVKFEPISLESYKKLAASPEGLSPSAMFA
jgi:KipI family sensor histidine kinase inhibitor